MAIYNSFRILISEQPSLFQPDRDKKEIFKEVLNRLVDIKREEFIYKGSRHIWFYLLEPSSNLYIFQFAKEERFNTPREVDGKIQIVVDIRVPYINVIIDWERQIFLIENKPSVFQSMDLIVQRLESYFESQINARTHANYKITLSAISRDVDFWNEVNEADRIYSLELAFNPPNMFEGRHEASELVKEAYGATKFSRFKLVFISDKGRLKVLRDNFKDFISLIASGGGSYLLKMVRSKGKKKESTRVNSRYFASQQTLPDDITQLKEEELNTKLRVIDKQNEDNKLIDSSKPASNDDSTPLIGPTSPDDMKTTKAVKLPRTAKKKKGNGPKNDTSDNIGSTDSTEQ
ncbi:hypothetical protein EXU85_20630 [Spirosoma sp. KCTC 42546]|uniref:hypothetical protein n=1 Tax=Spirosoma sp. KCTC 42546 TaxID=2520506 RepID=UPI001157404D|nr:hypothetical protein [Spirosoma sp. KCTC 42546]QDK80887.1 hypothetical protein EXU85_20630 [Spirosoma sp. KCTC 42546]